MLVLNLKAKGEDHGGRSPFTGKWPNGQALPHCDAHSSLGLALSVLPNAELLAVDVSRLAQATE